MHGSKEEKKKKKKKIEKTTGRKYNGQVSK